jgi:hypothetical protein
MLDLRSGGKTDYVMASRRDDQYIVRVSNVRLPSPTAELIDSYAVASRVTYSQIILFDALQQHGSTRRTSLPYPLGLDESSSTVLPLPGQCHFQKLHSGHLRQLVGGPDDDGSSSDAVLGSGLGFGGSGCRCFHGH